jgi:hypothetical protein
VHPSGKDARGGRASIAGISNGPTIANALQLLKLSRRADRHFISFRWMPSHDIVTSPFDMSVIVDKFPVRILGSVDAGDRTIIL